MNVWKHQKAEAKYWGWQHVNKVSQIWPKTRKCWVKGILRENSSDIQNEKSYNSLIYLFYVITTFPPHSFSFIHGWIIRWLASGHRHIHICPLRSFMISCSNNTGGKQLNIYSCAVFAIFDILIGYKPTTHATLFFFPEYNREILYFITFISKMLRETQWMIIEKNRNHVIIMCITEAVSSKAIKLAPFTHSKNIMLLTVWDGPLYWKRAFNTQR